jgi:hypothetical protein
MGMKRRILTGSLNKTAFPKFVLKRLILAAILSNNINTEVLSLSSWNLHRVIRNFKCNYSALKKQKFPVREKENIFNIKIHERKD